MEHEPIASIDLMERAAHAFVRHYTGSHSPQKPVHIFCGPGNNGGDGLAIGRLLHQAGYTAHIYVVRFTDQFSADFRENRKRLDKLALPVHDISSEGDLPPSVHGVLIDALFGSGLNKKLSGLPEAVVNWMNALGGEVVSVDIPSGLFADRIPEGAVVRASQVYTFQLPKLIFLLPCSAPYIGEWTVLDIGLSRAGLRQADTPYYYTNLCNARQDYQPRGRFTHKGSFGHALLIAGSKGKAGAAVLAARGALRSGAGLLTVHVPQAVLPVVQGAVPEAMCSMDSDEALATELPGLEAFSAIGAGPGIGTSEATGAMLLSLLRHTDRALVLDADALNLLAAHPDWLGELSPGTVLTPHPGEFRRLAGPWRDDLERLDKQREFSAKHHVVLALKDAHTSISAPDGNVYFNATGNNGMATAGSGDTLTGIITGLMAQGYDALPATRLGVYLHGLAGDLALETEHPNSLIASDLSRYLGKAFHHLDQCP